ncbi:MAG: hypothetical protein LCH38_10005 [Proteobacteria bacterium]|nr:hypothetical protein [Pseudomonadota bacterium]
MRSVLRAARMALVSGGFLIPGVFAPVAAMEFATIPVSAICEAANCPRAVIAEGEITADAPARFAQFLRQELQRPGLHAVVFMNSPGGNVESALKLGDLLHHAGAAVVVGRPSLAETAPRRRATSRAMGRLGVVPGQCASACVYALMGAKKRVVPDGARLGVHRMSAQSMMRDPSGGGPIGLRYFAGDQEIGTLRSYVARVGGSQELISLAESTPHDKIRILSAAEVRKYRLGTPSL